jgi:hypothetical protein
MGGRRAVHRSPAGGAPTRPGPTLEPGRRPSAPTGPILRQDPVPRPGGGRSGGRKVRRRVVFRDPGRRKARRRVVFRDPGRRKARRQVVVRDPGPRKVRRRAVVRDPGRRKARRRAVVRDPGRRKARRRVVVRQPGPRIGGRRGVGREPGHRATSGAAFGRDFGGVPGVAAWPSRAVAERDPGPPPGASTPIRSHDSCVGFVVGRRGPALDSGHPRPSLRGRTRSRRLRLRRERPHGRPVPARARVRAQRPARARPRRRPLRAGCAVPRTRARRLSARLLQRTTERGPITPASPPDITRRTAAVGAP